jgi:hypothetical protein
MALAPVYFFFRLVDLLDLGGRMVWSEVELEVKVASK